MLSSLEPKDWLNISIAGVVGWVISYFFYYKARQKKQMTFSVKRNLLLYKDPDYPNELEIRYAGRLVESVLRLSIYIWNSGNQPITASDLATLNPLRLAMTEQLRPLQIAINLQTRDANNAKIAPDGRIIFDYLNPNDGLVIDVLSEGPRSLKTKLVKLDGDVIGIAGKPSEEDFDLSSKKFNSFVAATVGVGFIMGAGFKFVNERLSFEFGVTIENAAKASLMALMALAGCLALFVGLGGMFFTKKVPFELLKGDFGNSSNWKARLRHFLGL